MRARVVSLVLPSVDVCAVCRQPAAALNSIVLIHGRRTHWKQISTRGERNGRKPIRPGWGACRKPKIRLSLRSHQLSAAAPLGAPGVAGAGFGALANSHFRRQIGQVFLLCSQVLMHMRWK